MHRPPHQRALREATDQTLALVIESIRAGNPEAFHTAETLNTRVFFHAPVRPLACAGFIRPYVPIDAQREREAAPLPASKAD